MSTVRRVLQSFCAMSQRFKAGISAGSMGNVGEAVVIGLPPFEVGPIVGAGVSTPRAGLTTVVGVYLEESYHNFTGMSIWIVSSGV